jgi:hypothetical protein
MQGLIYKALITTTLYFLYNQLPAQQWGSRVVDYQFGTGQNFGQDPLYFPANVLNPPAADLSPFVPAASPQQICSLGKNGYITIGFDTPVVDKAGADLVVFENVLQYANGLRFEEWIIVSVSYDNQTWITFPYDSISGTGLAGRTPTDTRNGYISGGDSFDLATIGIEQIKYVKLQDATRFQPPDRLSAEVDAIAAIQTDPSHINILHSQPMNPIIWFSNTSEIRIDPDKAPLIRWLTITDMLGKQLYQFTNKNTAAPLQLQLPPGVYCIHIKTIDRTYFSQKINLTL